jgi:hypothetical protein
MKKYPECIKDCDETLKLQPDYIKAFHRRGKANFALKNNLLAYKDFKYNPLSMLDTYSISSLIIRRSMAS